MMHDGGRSLRRPVAMRWAGRLVRQGWDKKGDALSGAGRRIVWLVRQGWDKRGGVLSGRRRCIVGGSSMYCWGAVDALSEGRRCLDGRGARGRREKVSGPSGEGRAALGSSVSEN